MAYTNYNLYTITIDRLRKDNKGSVTIEEFESMLSSRSKWLFAKKLNDAGKDADVQESLSPFYVPLASTVIGTHSSGVNYAPYPAGLARLLDAAYFSTSYITIDIISAMEYGNRQDNAVTAPSTTYPCGILLDTGLQVLGVTSGSVFMTYYKTPTNPYIDYYLDSTGNYHYLAVGGSHTLTTGEESRSGATSGSVSSTSVELEWDDFGKLEVLEYVLSDLGIAMNDQAIYQSSMFDRENIKQA